MYATENTAALAGGKKRRRGCLGCFGQVVLILLLGVVLIFAIDAVFAPWSFYLGGKFHIIPFWQGWGTLHSKTGDYVLYVQFEPSPSGSRTYPTSHVTGLGFLCSPRGERFRMKLGGDMRLHLNLSTDGEKMSLYMNNWPAFYGPFMSNHRPSIELRGQWHNPNLVMDDTGSISRAFLADGRVYTGHDPNHPYAGEIVPVTLKQGSYSEFKSACRADQQ
jgi:hypothetical protein